MGKYNFRSGDKLRVVDPSSMFKNGEIVTCQTDIDSNDGSDYVNVTLLDGNSIGGWCVSRFEKANDKENSPSKNVTKMKKTIYHVLAVDKKTGMETKNVTISADNEQQAILKAFGVDAENTFIKATEEGTYEEDKPLKAVLEKPKKE